MRVPVDAGLHGRAERLQGRDQSGRVRRLEHRDHGARVQRRKDVDADGHVREEPDPLAARAAVAERASQPGDGVAPGIGARRATTIGIARRPIHVVERDDPRAKRRRHRGVVAGRGKRRHEVRCRSATVHQRFPRLGKRTEKRAGRLAHVIAAARVVVAERRQDLRFRKRGRDLARQKLVGPGGERRERRSTRIRRGAFEVGLEAVAHEVAGDEHELRPRRRPLHRRQGRLEERIVGVAPVRGIGRLRGTTEDRAPARDVGALQRRHQRRIGERIEMQIAEDEHLVRGRARGTTRKRRRRGRAAGRRHRDDAATQNEGSGHRVRHTCLERYGIVVHADRALTNKFCLVSVPSCAIRRAD